MLANTGVFVDIFTKEGLNLKDNPQQIYDYFQQFTIASENFL